MAGQIHDFPLLVDVTTKTLLKEFRASVAEDLRDVHQGDTLRLLISAVRPNPLAASDPSTPWEYVTLASTLVAGIGDATAAPELGTFWLQFGSATSGTLTSGKRYYIATFVSGDDFTNVGAASNATGVIFTASGTTPTTWSNGSTLQEITTNLAYNISAANVQTALNAMASIAAAGSVDVTGDDGGPWRVVFRTVSDRNPITGNGDALYPSTDVAVYTARNGTANLVEIQTIHLESQPAALCDSFSAMPSAGVTIETIQGGASGVPEVQRITLDPQPYAGTFTLTFSAQTTAAIPYDSTAEEVQEFLEALSNIAADGADIEVTGASPQWQVSFKGALTGNQPAMTGDATGLRVPVGMIGLLDLNTEGILNLLDGDDSVDLTFEIEDSSVPCTLLHGDITVINDVIPDNPGAPRELPTYLTEDETTQQFLPGVPCSALTGGAAGALDALPTAAFLTTGTERTAVIGDLLSVWQLQAGTDAENGTTIVRPDDYSAGTNERVWKVVMAVGIKVQAWDGDLDALAALSGTNTIYYRSASNTWTAVTIGASLSFAAGTLAIAASGVNLATMVTGTLPVGNGGTGQTTLQAAINALAAASGALSQGDIFYYNGTNFVRLAAGTAGYVLATGGAGANPSWTQSILPRAYLTGLKLANNGSDATNDIDIAVGLARDSTDVADLRLASALTKRLDDNWAAGTNQGMRNSAAAITDTTYHIYLVSKAAGADVDIYAHTSTTVATVITALQAETGGSAYIYARRIGSIVRASATILAFTQDGDNFSITTPILDVSVTNLTTARSTYTLATMPTGLRMRAKIRALTSNAAANAIWIGDLTETDAAPSTTVSPLLNMINQVAGVSHGEDLEIFTNTSAQIGARSLAASTTLRIVTRGWVDRRGRDD